MDRYHRQMLLSCIGAPGQEHLRGSHALVVGCGALGCASADLLVRAGVGRVMLVDRDVVELTNLQRQSLFDERDVREGVPKAEAARRRLEAVNSDVRIGAVVADVTARNAERILAEAGGGGGRGVIVDGTDNLETRYLINDLAVKHRVAYIYGGAVGVRGMQMTVRAGGRPCLRCIFEEPPAPGAIETCDTAGVFGPAVAMVGAWQASAAMRVLLGESPGEELVEFDAWSGRERRIDISRAAREACPCCGRGVYEFLSGARGGETVVLCGRESVQVSPPSAGEGARVDLGELASRLRAHGPFEAGRFVLRGELTRERGERGPIGLTVFPDGRAIVHGTTDAARARGVYARYVG